MVEWDVVNTMVEDARDSDAQGSGYAQARSVELVNNTRARCDAPNPGGPLTTRQSTEFLWISGDLIPHCCVPYIRIHIFTKIG